VGPLRLSFATPLAQISSYATVDDYVDNIKTGKYRARSDPTETAADDPTQHSWVRETFQRNEPHQHGRSLQLDRTATAYISTDVNLQGPPLSL